MLIKSFSVLKRNPSIYIVYFLFLMIYSCLGFFLRTDATVTTDLSTILLNLVKLSLILIFGGITTVLYASGWGNMLSEAILCGSTSFNSFFQGVKKFFGRILLLGLLFLAFIISITMVLSIITVVITIALSMSAIINPQTISLIMVGIIYIVNIFIYPFFLLWLPALFIDNIGVIDGLKEGFKVSIKKYWPLVLITLIMTAPSAIYSILFSNTLSGEYIYKLNYWIMIVINAIISLILTVYMFLIYKNTKTTDNNMEIN